ncbi:hypothetical protein ACKLNR_014622 [Fusarium oxysporum f. sp. zingiberi]
MTALDQIDINRAMLQRLQRLEKAVFPNGAEASPQAMQFSEQRPACYTPFGSHFANPSPPTSSPSSARFTYLMSKLPPLEQANILFDNFVSAVHPTFHVLHIPSTKKHMQETYANMTEDKEKPKAQDLLMLFSIFAGAALAWTDELFRKLGATKENVTSAFECYFNCALSIVYDSRISLLPSVTALSAISTLEHIAMNSDDVPMMKGFILRTRRYLMCHEMMVYRLDSPAVQKEREVNGANAIELEVQRRIWWNMVASDWLNSFSGSPHDGVYNFVPRLMKVLKPCNVDDDKITVSGPTPNFPLSLPTDMTFFLLRLKAAEISREIVDTIPPLVDDTLEEDYDVILGLDRKLQDFANNLPEFCKINAESIENSRWVCEERPSIYWQRISLHFGIHVRIWRLHRPYHLEAYSNPRYSYSRTASIQSAYRILELRRMMDDAGAKLNFRPERYWFIFLHVTSAALTLAADASYNSKAPNTEAFKEKITTVYEHFNTWRRKVQSLIKGLEKNMEQVMGSLQKQRSHTVNPALSTKTPGANWRSADHDGIFADINDVTMGMPGDGFGDEHSHQLWSDFLAAVPDLKGFHWASLLQDMD